MAERQRWDNFEIAGKFGSEPDNIFDGRDGHGVTIALENAHLELFEDSRIVRYKDPNILIEMLKVTSAKPMEEWVKFEAEAGETRSTLQFHPASKTITFTQGPTKEDKDEAAAPAKPVAEAKSETAEKEAAMSFRGRVVRDPALAQSKSGKDFIKVTIAVPVEGSQRPDYRDVYWYGDKAKDLVGKFSKGNPVNVRAYEKKRERTKRNGEKVEQTYFNGVYIGLPK